MLSVGFYCRTSFTRFRQQLVARVFSRVPIMFQEAIAKQRLKWGMRNFIFILAVPASGVT